jgi:uncharacterized protein (DUF486 family)
MKTAFYVISITIFSSVAIAPNTIKTYPSIKAERQVLVIKAKELELRRVINLVEYNLDVDEIDIGKNIKHVGQLKINK